MAKRFQLPAFVMKRNRALERAAIKGDKRLKEALVMIGESMKEESESGHGYWQRFCEGILVVRSKIIKKVAEENRKIQECNEALGEDQSDQERDYLEVPASITWPRLIVGFVPGRGIQLEYPEPCFARYLGAAETLGHEFAVEMAAGLGRFDLLWPDEIAAFSSGGIEAMLKKFEEKRAQQAADAPQTPEPEQTEEGEED